MLSSPLQDLELPEIPQKVYPELVAEQGISGLCTLLSFINLNLPRLYARSVFAGSTVCFVLASLNYPEAIRLIFGRSAADMEQITWEYLNLAGSDVDRDDGGLSMMLRMTRLDDLGLGQLLFS